MSIWFTFSQ